MDALSTLQHVRLVPVVSIADADHAVPLARALLAGGIPAIEVTLRTEAALDAIAAIAHGVPDIIVGAGSIRRPEQLRAAQERGARFGVCPGSSPSLLDAAADASFPFVPGASTASEMIALLERGYTLQKFFPAERLGGLATIKALSAPLPEVLFFPTGGIDASIARDYLAFDRVQCIGGSWFVSNEAVVRGEFAVVEAAARAAMQVIEGVLTNTKP